MTKQQKEIASQQKEITSLQKEIKKLERENRQLNQKLQRAEKQAKFWKSYFNESMRIGENN